MSGHRRPSGEFGHSVADAHSPKMYLKEPFHAVCELGAEELSCCIELAEAGRTLVEVHSDHSNFRPQIE